MLDSRISIPKLAAANAAFQPISLEWREPNDTSKAQIRQDSESGRPGHNHRSTKGRHGKDHPHDPFGHCLPATGEVGGGHRHRVAGFGESDGLTHRQTSGWRVAAELDSLRRDHDLVLLDNPPHAETDLKIAIRGADLLLVPVQLSPADLWAMQATIDLGRAERKDALLVYNRVPPRGRSSQEVRDRIEKSDVEVASTQLGNRIAYSASLMSGLGVTEFAPRSAAAAEITDLASELIERLGRTPRPSSILLPRESRTSIETRPH